MTELSLDTRVAADESVLSREIEGDTVLLSMTRSEYYGLNPTGTRVWQLLQQPSRLADVCATMASEFDAESSEIERDVLGVVRDLIAHDLVRIVAEPTA
jgi:Coenzyme PQQ synthesis protein D (PqqD)